jgi:hypothetical protein
MSGRRRRVPDLLGGGLVLAAGAVLLLVALGAGSCRSVALPVAAGASAGEISVLGAGPLIVPYGAKVDGFRVGGLSGISRAADGSYLAVVDNEGDTPARVFRLAFTVDERGVSPPPGKTLLQVQVAAIRLSGASGALSADDFDGRNFDGEGIAVTAKPTLLISSEIEPSVRELSPDGKLLGELPVPPLFRAGKRHGTRSNLGFESVALAAGATGETVWTANERPLWQDVPEDDETRPSPVRLLRFDRRSGGGAGGGFTAGPQYVYEVERIRGKLGHGFAVRGLSDLLALPDGDLLALEREYVFGRGFRIQLYRVSLAGATDVSGFETLLGKMPGKDWKGVHKTLLFDFARAGFVADNLEGMTFGPDLADGSRTLVLVSDNNFEPLQKTQIVALRWRRERWRGGK